MVQTFNPAKVMLADTVGKEVTNNLITAEFVRELANVSKVIQLGERIEMGNQYIKKVKAVDGELSDAYFVGEGEKIGIANVATKDYTLETKKVAVILPVTQEFLTYTWSQYFEEVKPLIVDKFNKVIDGDVFLGLHGNTFGTNVNALATANDPVTGGITFDNLITVESLVDSDPTAFVGHRSINTALRGSYDENTKTYLYDRNTNTLDGLPYHELKLAKGATYPANTLFVGDFKAIKYGLPQGTGLRLKLADQATLSKVQNAGPDTGDVHLFEQDMMALRAIFEIAVAIPNEKAFAKLDTEKVADEPEV